MSNLRFVPHWRQQASTRPVLISGQGRLFSRPVVNGTEGGRCPYCADGQCDRCPNDGICQCECRSADTDARRAATPWRRKTKTEN
jgi:hypothetical protein